MSKKVRIPTPLRKLTNNEELVEITAATIGEAIVELQTRFPGIQERLVDDKGEILEGAASGNLVILDSWPGQMRTVYGDHDRFVQT